MKWSFVREIQAKARLPVNLTGCKSCGEAEGSDSGRAEGRSNSAELDSAGQASGRCGRVARECGGQTEGLGS